MIIYMVLPHITLDDLCFMEDHWDYRPHTMMVDTGLNSGIFAIDESSYKFFNVISRNTGYKINYTSQLVILGTTHLNLIRFHVSLGMEYFDAACLVIEPEAKLQLQRNREDF